MIYLEETWRKKRWNGCPSTTTRSKVFPCSKKQKQHLKERIQSVIDKYNKYDCVIFVFHQLAIKSVVNVEKVKPAEIIEYVI